MSKKYKTLGSYFKAPVKAGPHAGHRAPKRSLSSSCLQLSWEEAQKRTSGAAWEGQWWREGFPTGKLTILEKVGTSSWMPEMTQKEDRVPSEPAGERQCGRGTMGLQVRREAAWCLGGGHMSKLGLQELRVQMKELEMSERVRQRLGVETHSWGFILLRIGSRMGSHGKAFSGSDRHFK